MAVYLPTAQYWPRATGTFTFKVHTSCDLSDSLVFDRISETIQSLVFSKAFPLQGVKQLFPGSLPNLRTVWEF